MTTEVTIEVTEDEERYLRSLVDSTRTTPRNSLNARVTRKLGEALPDPEESIVFEMLSAYAEAANLPGPVRHALNGRMVAGMKAVLELVRERDASE